MITKLSCVIGEGVNPYDNIALEEELLSLVEPEECILYLWQNKNTVVIGHNQNCHRECKVKELEEAGGHLARRLSGGGAVFHDLGNLNFTLLMHKQNYDLKVQNEIILRAVCAVGVDAERTGRNDIVVKGRKFSGNAYYSRGGRSLHHGTLLVNVDMQMLSRYLTVSEDKLRAHGVKSVQSRVINLSEVVPDLTVEQLRGAMIAAVGEVYGGVAKPLDISRIDTARLAARRERFASWDWRIGQNPRFSSSVQRRFVWGGLELGVVVESGRITQATLYTDALDADLAPAVESALVGVRFAAEEMHLALHNVYGPNAAVSGMIRDIATIVGELM